MTGSGGRDGRALVLEYVERQLLGPLDGETELLQERPQRRYLTGILFPRDADTGTDPGLSDDISDDLSDSIGEDAGEDPLALAGQQLPSSVALSFFLPQVTSVRVEIETARYVKDGTGWRRRPIALTGDAAMVLSPPAHAARTSRVDMLEGTASLDAVWRPVSGGGVLVTVALVNRCGAGSDGKVDPSDCLFQVRMRCGPMEGLLGPYPSILRLNNDREDEELALLYRKVPTFGVGHGAAAIWPVRTDDGAAWVETSYLPRHGVPSVNFSLPEEAARTGAASAMSLSRLMRITNRPGDVFPLLDTFVDAYDEWAVGLEPVAAKVEGELAEAAKRLLERVGRTRKRMRKGVELLRNDPDIREAFGLANRAMLRQMIRTRAPFSGRRSWKDHVPVAPADYDDPQLGWRPFQLAFLLLTLESMADPECTDRDTVDLIWFPTGGGKTEAYLGAMAFSIFHRRLRSGDEGAGVTVMTRYTLRLLTAQQFQRAAALACACETIRQENPGVLGSIPISIGIWVGGENSPNSYAEAVKLLETIRNREETRKGFQLELCPWCSTELLPSGDEPDAAWGVRAANDSFGFRCPNAECDFHEGLPISSVDEDLYRNPPTILIGTVDKFARLAWDDQAGVLLGAGATPGPSLIVQDEFHLISGPLGTMVGLYEAAFDTVMGIHGTRPKVLASTATIRRADEQSRGVFGRKVALFPPSGLDADDSYFVRFDRDQPGRLYVGAMPQGHTPLTAMVHLSAALLQAPVEQPLQPPLDDAYWTLLAYHNSLRELGKTVTLAHDDIPARIGVIATAEEDARKLRNDEILELTSNISSVEIPRNLERLSIPKGSKGAVSFAASTNMISVGVDVSRLGVMLVVGQPKTTAEYVQATSRVGRQVPGLVVTLYSPAKPRDRSHYESFVPYHSSLYRYVEPTSVTPFSVPARDRALHAALVVLARHGRGWARNDQAGEFDPDDPRWQRIVDAFLRRVEHVGGGEQREVQRQIAQIQEKWMILLRKAEPEGGLRYRAIGRQQVGLLHRFGGSGDGWATLDSMRSIDVDVRMLVRGAS
ncbi:helicase-related protein [Polymorphospora rubra]|uniref:helicase-related protein n=1 Tax=Polymorphospora rubra TaxID=338584 RepID=UPI0033DEEF11